ncbi:MAG: hypothetical protein K6E61_01135 [Bacteroidales bacterium]|nr:hypothetical protein [Bacteroidales bacterium]
MSRSCSALLAGLVTILLISGCGPSGNQLFREGEFSFSYPAGDYEIKERTSDGPYTSFILSSRKAPSNQIEFSIYRYEPEFVETIVPSELAKEIQIDVMAVGERASSKISISSQSGLMVPDEVSFPYTVDAFVIGNTQDGDDVVLRVSSTQIEYYNVITVAWGDSPETVRSYADILSSFRVDK